MLAATVTNWTKYLAVYPGHDTDMKELLVDFSIFLTVIVVTSHS
jgi:hypothetical protein